IMVEGCGTVAILNVTQNGQSVGSGISFTPSTISLDWSAGSSVAGNIAVGNNTFWTAQSNDPWILLNNYSGSGPQGLTISAASDNETGQVRFGTVTLQSGGDSFIINVEQIPKPTGGTEPPWGSVTPSNLAGVFIGQAQIDGIPADEGDWVAAFDEAGNLAGSNPVIINQGIAYINLTIYGDDGQTSADEGISNSEAFTLHLWDISENEVLDYPFTGAATLFTEWTNVNGAPMPAYSSPATIYNFERIALDIIPLQAGWNLVSTDVSPADSSIASLFAGLIPENLEYVTGFDQVPSFYDPSLPFLSTLTHWTRGFGYWVRVTQDDTLRVPGMLIPEAYFKPMTNGWNLISFLPQSPQSPEDYLNAFISSGQLEYATGFDGTPSYYDPNNPIPVLNSLQEMRNSLGYWIRLQNIGPLQNLEARSSIICPNLNYSFLWGWAKVPEGSSLEILDSKGTLLGEIKVDKGGFIEPFSLYGDDPATLELDGIQEGEQLYFKYQNQLAGTPFVFKSDRLLHRLNIEFPTVTSNNYLTASPVPFDNVLDIQYNLPKKGAVHVLIKDGLGRIVENQLFIHDSPGNYRTSWNSKSAAEGLYTVSLVLEEQVLQILPVVLQR
ncbi:MAG: BACON domain-containing protein, partial [Phaeodactylibacter sp.]|nr:BACON domain-containing protein [Phaeodactylibacter sp.]